MLTRLQFSRFVAAFAVVIFHANVFFLPRVMGGDYATMSWLNIGYTGVEYFFVLSGFIMMRVHRRDIGQPNAALPFLLKRFIRIYPFYWIVLLGAVLLNVVSLAVGMGEGITLSELLHSAALVPSGERLILVAAWTLCHELLFYLVFSVSILSRRGGFVLLLCWIAACIANTVWLDLPFPFSFLFSYFNILFSFGILVAVSLSSIPGRLSSPLWIVGLAFFVLVALLDVYEAWPFGVLARTLSFGLSAGFIVAGLAKTDMDGKPVSSPAMDHLGAASYSIYLVHGPALLVFSVFAKMAGLGTVLPGPLIGVAMIVFATAAGFAAYWIIERPLLRVLKSRVGRSRKPVLA